MIKTSYVAPFADDPYKNLAAAIVRQAVLDYKSAVKILIEYPRHIDARQKRDSLRKFFCSEWFTVLSDLDGEVLMNNIETLAEEEMGL